MNLEGFSDLKFLVAGENVTTRHTVCNALNEFGFKDVRQCSNVIEIVQELKQGVVDQVLTPLFLDQNVNIFHLLNYIVKGVLPRKARFSLLVTDEEQKLIPSGFKLGMYTFHPRTYSRQSLLTELNYFLNTFKMCRGLTPLISAEYFWNHAKTVGDFSAAKSLAVSMLERFPGEGSILYRLGEAQLRSEESALGETTLRRLCLIDPAFSDKANALLQANMSAKNSAPSLKMGSETQNEVPSALGITYCVILDPDSAASSFLKSIFLELGVKNVQIFESAEHAWDWMRTHGEPDLIVQEWKFSGKMNGAVFVQRLRNSGLHKVPIVVMSSLIRPQDAPLIREFGIDGVIAKPFNKEAFIKHIVHTLQQAQLPTMVRPLEIKIRRLLSKGNIEEAERLQSQYISTKGIRPEQCKLLEAEFLFAKEDFAAARSTAIEAMKSSGDSLLTLALIGRSSLKLGDFKTAKKVFERVHSLSSQNIDHLCMLALCQYECGEKEASEQNIQLAISLDPQRVLVQETECKVALVDGQVKRATRLANLLPDIGGVVSYMNARAITFILDRQYEEGVNLYKKTLEVLPLKWGEVRASVEYNLGLAYARAGDYKTAISHLEEALKQKNIRVVQKSASLIKRLKTAIQENKRLEFQESAERFSEVSNVTSSPSSENVAGEYCLLGILNSECQIAEEVQKSIANTPDFFVKFTEKPVSAALTAK